MDHQYFLFFLEILRNKYSIEDQQYHKINECLEMAKYIKYENLESPESWHQHQNRGSVPYDDPLLERFSTESYCYKEICQPGCLLRIKAPCEMGKTTLMIRTLDHFKAQGGRTVLFRFTSSRKN